MRYRQTLYVLVFLVGVLLVAVGGGWLTTATVYYAEVQATVTPTDVPDDATVVEFQRLSEPAREAFRRSLASGGRARIGPDRGGFTTGYVRYRDSLYVTLLVVADQDRAPAYVVLACGFLLGLLAGLGWRVDRTTSP